MVDKTHIFSRKCSTFRIAKSIFSLSSGKIGIFAARKKKHMQGKYKVITLCGSTKFKEAFLDTQKRLTLEGNIVISVGLFGHSGDEEVWNPGIKDMFDDMHLRKIDMADEVYVVNVGGYIGESTKREIEYAKGQGKMITYLEGHGNE